MNYGWSSVCELSIVHGCTEDDEDTSRSYAARHNGILFGCFAFFALLLLLGIL